MPMRQVIPNKIKRDPNRDSTWLNENYFSRITMRRNANKDDNPPKHKGERPKPKLLTTIMVGTVESSKYPENKPLPATDMSRAERIVSYSDLYLEP
ncbi:hypothetical protein ACMFMG_002747 [Clarireedia jacksonii]